MNKVVSIISALILVLGFAGTAVAEPTQAESKATAEVVMERVNINTADVETLSANLHRVGPKTAAAIIDWRENNGKFTSKEQLMEVKGIGETTLKDNLDRIAL